MFVLKTFDDKGLSMKEVRTQRGGGLSSADILRTKGVLQMRTSALFKAKKHRVFRNLWYVRTDKGKGLLRADILRTVGRGVNFS